MKSSRDARILAQALVETANLAECKTLALITDMSEPLASSIGNSVEVNEVICVLVQAKEGRLKELCLKLGSELLVANGLMDSLADARRKLISLLESGAAAETFGKMIAEMGGPSNFIEHWTRFLPEASVILEVKSDRRGYVNGWDSEALGMICVNLGGGRKVETDTIDPAVGISDIAPIGTYIQKGNPVAKIHAARIESAERAARQVLNSLLVTENIPTKRPLVMDKVI